MIRICGGEFRSRKLLTPQNENITKPTMDRVREGVFSILQNDIYNSIVLDLFSGSGAYAFEALSRGAKEVTSIDNNNESIKIIKENARTLRVEDRINIIKDDVFHYLSNASKKFDIIFADPPYKSYDYNEIIKAILDNDLLNEDGILILESEDDLVIDENNWQKCRKYKYSLAKIYVLRK